MEEVEHEQFTFSIHGLIFLSGEWMRKSPFSLSSMNAFILGDIGSDLRIKAMTLQQVHLKENCAERNQKEDLRLDGLAERPPLHLGLEPHVGDLQAEAVPVHAAAGGVVGVGVEVVGEGKWAGIIDWEAAGGCGTHLPGAARPPTGFLLTFLKLSGGGGLVAEPLS